ncbi:uncharacterized protein LOC143239422 [Tachypleus tridentatus]|uniref:uncharacterized protein LOC143239422 n=1 Tax=Tachypleus tridentatus TaxID=6853 RepID=UPI003FD3AAAF
MDSLEVAECLEKDSVDLVDSIENECEMAWKDSKENYLSELCKLQTQFTQICEWQLKVLEEKELSQEEKEQEKGKVLMSYVSMLSEQNEVLIQALTHLEKEAKQRVSQMDGRLKISARTTKEAVLQLSEWEQEMKKLVSQKHEMEVYLEETQQLLSAVKVENSFLRDQNANYQHDLQSLLRVIQNARSTGNWEMDCVTFCEVSPEDVFGPIRPLSGRLSRESFSGQENSVFSHCDEFQSFGVASSEHSSCHTSHRSSWSNFQECDSLEKNLEQQSSAVKSSGDFQYLQRLREETQLELLEKDRLIASLETQITALNHELTVRSAECERHLLDLEFWLKQNKSHASGRGYHSCCSSHPEYTVVTSSPSWGTQSLPSMCHQHSLPQESSVTEEHYVRNSSHSCIRVKGSDMCTCSSGDYYALPCNRASSSLGETECSYVTPNSDAYKCVTSKKMHTGAQTDIIIKDTLAKLLKDAACQISSPFLPIQLPNSKVENASQTKLMSTSGSSQTVDKFCDVCNNEMKTFIQNIPTKLQSSLCVKYASTQTEIFSAEENNQVNHKEKDKVTMDHVMLICGRCGSSAVTVNPNYVDDVDETLSGSLPYLRQDSPELDGFVDCFSRTLEPIEEEPNCPEEKAQDVPPVSSSHAVITFPDTFGNQHSEEITERHVFQTDSCKEVKCCSSQINTLSENCSISHPNNISNVHSNQEKENFELSASLFQTNLSPEVQSLSSEINVIPVVQSLCWTNLNSEIQSSSKTDITHEVQASLSPTDLSPENSTSLSHTDKFLEAQFLSSQTNILPEIQSSSQTNTLPDVLSTTSQTNTPPEVQTSSCQTNLNLKIQSSSQTDITPEVQSSSPRNLSSEISTSSSQTYIPPKVQTSSSQTNSPPEVQTSSSQTNALPEVQTSSSQTNAPPEVQTSSSQTNAPPEVQTSSSQTNTPPEVQTSSCQTNKPPEVHSSSQTNTLLDALSSSSQTDITPEVVHSFSSPTDLAPEINTSLSQTDTHPEVQFSLSQTNALPEVLSSSSQTDLSPEISISSSETNIRNENQSYHSEIITETQSSQTELKTEPEFCMTNVGTGIFNNCEMQPNNHFVSAESILVQSPNQNPLETTVLHSQAYLLDGNQSVTPLSYNSDHSIQKLKDQLRKAEDKAMAKEMLLEQLQNHLKVSFKELELKDKTLENVERKLNTTRQDCQNMHSKISELEKEIEKCLEDAKHREDNLQKCIESREEELEEIKQQQLVLQEQKRLLMIQLDCQGEKLLETQEEVMKLRAHLEARVQEVQQQALTITNLQEAIVHSRRTLDGLNQSGSRNPSAVKRTGNPTVVNI